MTGSAELLTYISKHGVDGLGEVGGQVIVDQIGWVTGLGRVGREG